MKIAFDWVDAFSGAPFGGNGCAVLHDAAHLDAQTCMNVVRETSLVECTFTGPSDVADIRVRYFLASREIPFAGHPTLATVAAMYHRGLLASGDFTLETGAGIVPVHVDCDGVSMTQIAPEFRQHVAPDVVAPVYGLTPADIAATPQIVSTGLPFCITPIATRAALDSAYLVPDALAAYFAHIGAKGTDMMEPFLVHQHNAGTFARLLLAPPSPAEDPFTGSATGAMAAYLWHHGLIDVPQFTAAQGDRLGRPGRAHVEVLGPRHAINGVRVSGQGYVLMSGEMYL